MSCHCSIRTLEPATGVAMRFQWGEESAKGVGRIRFKYFLADWQQMVGVTAQIGHVSSCCISYTPVAFLSSHSPFSNGLLTAIPENYSVVYIMYPRRCPSCGCPSCLLVPSAPHQLPFRVNQILPRYITHILPHFRIQSSLLIFDILNINNLITT